MVNSTATSILDRLLDPVAACLTPDVAQRIVSLQMEPALQAHIDELATKANLGQLSAEERTEYEEIVEGIDLVAIFKAKARLALTRQGQ